MQINRNNEMERQRDQTTQRERELNKKIDADKDRQALRYLGTDREQFSKINREARKRNKVMIELNLIDRPLPT